MKTVENDGDVHAFIAGVENDRRRGDAEILLALMGDVTGWPARMWGDSIIGFGRYHYKYESGREGTFFRTGFSPRKQNMVVYIMPGFSAHDGLMAQLGKHKTGRSCLYINKLADVDLDVLRELVEKSVAWMGEKYPES
ncbi:MAG: DUF1801 domain-containing protein [Pseudomonadota bacterium]